MKIEFDKEADALYIEFSDKEFSKNEKVNDNTILDMDKEGNVIGIELLDVSNKLPKEALFDINVKNIINRTEQD